MKIYNFFLGVCLLANSYTGNAQNAYEDPTGEFVIDLYDGLEDQEQQIDLVYQFKNEQYALVMQKTQNSNDLESAYSTAMEILRNAGLKNMEIHTPTKLITVNGNKAIEGTYVGDFDANGVEVKLTGMAYAIALDESTLSIMTVLNDANYEKAGSLVQKTFHSIRIPAQEPTGVTAEEVVNLSVEELTKEAEAGKNTEPTEVMFGDISMTLPPGWVKQEKNRSDAENIIGKFKNSISGTSGFVMALKGMIWNKKRVNQVAFEVGRDALQGSDLVKSKEIALQNKKKAFIHQHTGTVVADGREIEMSCITFAHKAGKQFLVYVLTTGSSNTNDIEKDLLSMANSVK